MVHRGQILENYIRAAGYNLTKLADQLPWKVKTLYRHFETADLSYDRIIEYSKALKYDFAKEFPELKAYEWLVHEPEPELKASPAAGENEAVFYRKKYEELLGKYTDLLERYNLILERGMPAS